MFGRIAYVGLKAPHDTTISQDITVTIVEFKISFLPEVEIVPMTPTSGNPTVDFLLALFLRWRF